MRLIFFYIWLRFSSFYFRKKSCFRRTVVCMSSKNASLNTKPSRTLSVDFLAFSSSSPSFSITWTWKAISKVDFLECRVGWKLWFAPSWKIRFSLARCLYKKAGRSTHHCGTLLPCLYMRRLVRMILFRVKVLGKRLIQVHDDPYRKSRLCVLLCVLWVFFAFGAWCTHESQGKFQGELRVHVCINWKIEGPWRVFKRHESEVKFIKTIKKRFQSTFSWGFNKIFAK